MDEIVWEEPPAPTAKIVWEEPPAPTAKGGRARTWEPKFFALMERPGEWARVATYEDDHKAHVARHNLMRTWFIDAPKDEFEIKARKVDGGSALFARYLPKPKALKEAK